MIDHTRTFYENIKDAFYFAVSDKVSIVIIGIILTIAGTLEEYHTNDPLLSIISIIVLLCFLLFEAGYSSKIIVETLEGSTKTPAIENIPEMLTHVEGIYSNSWIFYCELYIGYGSGRNLCYLS